MEFKLEFILENTRDRLVQTLIVPRASRCEFKLEFILENTRTG